MPLLGVVADPNTTDAVRPLVRALRCFARIRALGRCTSAPAAVFATSEAVLGRAPGDTPVAVWLDRPSSPLPGEVIAVGPAVGRAGIHVAPGGIDLTGLDPIGPAVRSRWRQRYGLPPAWVIDAASIDVADRTTAFALCAAAVVGGRCGPGLVVALALGAPVVTFADTAASIGAVNDVQVAVVAPGDDPLAVARGLAADPHRCARLGTAGRTLIEDGLDLRTAARRLSGCLGLTVSSSGPLAVLEDRLDELHTATLSPIRNRASTAVVTGAAP